MRHDDTWDGTSTGVAPALEALSRDAQEGGGRAAAPASRSLGSAWAGLSQSVWRPILVRALAVGCGMIGFAAIGAWSMARSESGVHLLSQAAPSASITWLAATAAPVKLAGSLPAVPPVSAGDAKGGCGKNGALCDAGPPASPPGLTEDGKVILNVAGAEVLTRLPGVGKVRAEAILALRTRLKRFRRVTDLLRVRGIGVRSLKRMTPHLVLDPPKVEAPGAQATADG